MLFLCKTGVQDFGQPLTEPPMVGQVFQAVFVPDVGSHIIVTEGPDQQLRLLGVIYQREPGVSWIIRPYATSSNTLMRLDGRGDGKRPFVFTQPGTVTVYLMTVPEAVALEVAKRDFLAVCPPEDVVEWQKSTTFSVHSVCCDVQPGDEKV